MIAPNQKRKTNNMNTNQSNASFQSIRACCFTATTRMLLGAVMVCLIGSAWADGGPIGVLRFRGTLVTAEIYQYYARSDRSLETVRPLVSTPYIMAVAAGGHANANPLGQFRVVYAGIVDFATGASPQCARFIDANGDSIYTTTTGQMSETGNPTVKSIIEFHSVVGGTGYYTDATGSFTVTRLLTFAPDGLTGRSEGSFNGLIHVIFQPPGL